MSLVDLMRNNRTLIQLLTLHRHNRHQTHLPLPLHCLTFRLLIHIRLARAPCSPPGRPPLRQRAVDRRETRTHTVGAHNPLSASELNANRSARSVLSRKPVHPSVRHHITPRIRWYGRIFCAAGTQDRWMRRPNSVGHACVGVWDKRVRGLRQY